MHSANPFFLSKPWLISTGAPNVHDNDYARDNVTITSTERGVYDNTGEHVPNGPYRIFVSGAPDFSPFMYLNVPIAYVSGVVPAPTTSTGLAKPAIKSSY
jgi:hypothetical protein